MNLLALDVLFQHPWKQQSLFQKLLHTQTNQTVIPFLIFANIPTLIQMPLLSGFLVKLVECLEEFLYQVQLYMILKNVRNI